MRTVADDRHRLAREGGDDDLAVLTVRDGLARHGVDDLGDVLVVPLVQAAVELAVLAGGADATGLRHAVDVEALDVQALLDALAELVRERLGPEDAHAQGRDVVVARLLRVEHLDDARHVGDNRTEPLHAEIAHELDLAHRVAARGGHAEEPGLAAAVVAAETTVEETERRHDLERVARLEAGHREAAGHAVGPLVQVVLRVGHDDGRARGAGRLVELQELLARHRAHLERVGVAEVVLREERDALQVVERLHVLRAAEAAALQQLAAPFAHPYAAERLLQPLQLDVRVLVAAHRLGFTVPEFHHSLRFSDLAPRITSRPRRGQVQRPCGSGRAAWPWAP